jgi:peptidoglycan/LPS O-acetylase OafA/YrhL
VQPAPEGLHEEKTLRRDIKSHTGLRGLAALLVVAYHQQFGAGYKLPMETATSFFGRCYLMVDLFFILSGFILCYVTNAHLGITLSQARRFFQDRFARIYPLHVFALGFLTAFMIATTALFAVTGHGHQELGSFGDWLSQLFLLNAWRRAHTEWNIPSWSISAEAFAYILFPMLVNVWAARSRLTEAAVLAGCITFYVLIGPSLDITVGLAPLRCLAGFGLGMLIFHHREIAERVRGRSLTQMGAVTWVVASLVLPVPDPLIIPGFAALVLLTWTDKGLVARTLSAAPLQWLGTLSYSIYLMHVPVGDVVWFVWARVEHQLDLDPALSRVMFLSLTFGIVLAAARFTYTYVEKPWRERLRHRRAASSIAAVSAP